MQPSWSQSIDILDSVSIFDDSLFVSFGVLLYINNFRICPIMDFGVPTKFFMFRWPKIAIHNMALESYDALMLRFDVTK